MRQTICSGLKATQTSVLENQSAAEPPTDELTSSLQVFEKRSARDWVTLSRRKRSEREDAPLSTPNLVKMAITSLLLSLCSQVAPAHAAPVVFNDRAAFDL